MSQRGSSGPAPPPLQLSPEAAGSIRTEISRAGGREVSFLVEVGEDRILRGPRAVSRGNRTAVLVAAKGAPVGSLVLHNHPSGELEPSEADLAVAGELYQRGLGTAIVDNRVTCLYVVVEPPPPRTVEPQDLDEMALVGFPTYKKAGKFSLGFSARF